MRRDLSLRQGNAPVSAYFCACFAHFQVVMGDVQKAAELGQIAVRLNQTIGSQAIACAVHFLLGAFVAFWTRSLSESVEHLRLGRAAALDAGDYLYACYCAMGEAVFAFQRGEALEDVAEVARQAADLIDRTGDVTNHDVVSSLRSTVDRLQSTSGATVGVDDTEAERRIVESGNPFVISCHFQFAALEKYLDGDWEGASIGLWPAPSPGCRAISTNRSRCSSRHCCLPRKFAQAASTSCPPWRSSRSLKPRSVGGPLQHPRPSAFATPWSQPSLA
jgi:hypothetical protein